MTTTLILLFHPDLSRSKANRALADAASTLPDVETIDMQALYPTGVVDAAREVRRLLTADRIVLQFPVQWYSAPALLKAWQDAVLTRMFYINYESEGILLEGTPLMVAATAGNVPEAYTPTGANRFQLEELFRPLEATALRCSLPWSKPFLVFRAGDLDGASLAATGQRYAERLRQWSAAVEPQIAPRCASFG